jgi:predicted nucleic acid-binding Zn ribbon protein
MVTKAGTLAILAAEATMKLIDRLCKNCEHTDEYLRDRTEEGPWKCEACGVDAMVEAMLNAPRIRDSNSASYLDGTRRSGSFYELKEANKLKQQLQSVKPEDRKPLKQEIQKLGGTTDS